MSTAKHSFYRKVLSIRRSTLRQGNLVLPVTSVLYCSRGVETARATKTTLIGYKVYVGNRRCNGVDAYHPKQTLINNKTPLSSKFFKDIGERSLKRTEQKALNEAFISYVLSKPELSKNIEGKVSYFDKMRGEGMVKIESHDLYLPVYACNILGKKTWYPQTACMYLERDQVIRFDLTEGERTFFVTKVQDGLFDKEKWDKLDHERLAFRCDENGKATNGLFAKGAGLWD